MATHQLNPMFKTSMVKNYKTQQQQQPRTPRFHVFNNVKTTSSTTTTTMSGRKLIESGTVKAIFPKEASSAMNSDGFILLDVRPTWEAEKARVVGSVHVPIFVEDTDNSPVTLLKKWVHLGYIGLWTGQYLTTLNPEFVGQVEVAIPDKASKVLVACGEGLRSLTAASKLYNGGYRNLGWLAGGFSRSKDDDFPVIEGTEKLQYATIGGVSYYFLQLLILLKAVGK
ncbi:Rhodanese-like domain-containing protein 10 [Stylosanthes scabra]|uniref:Rhodanese-like domain-containing protein 10 n=1 Tax=Stylosanthes scabra TaxID=79078 RepID=A0ABU6RBK5_9FABA|nr:Rhodanese-like domain-containing protein 10 [Stylosanthes scabra]